MNVLIAPSSSSSQWGIKYFKRTYSVCQGGYWSRSVLWPKSRHITTTSILYEKDTKGIQRIVVGVLRIVD